jgi:Myb-like DNA-binding domain
LTVATFLDGRYHAACRDKWVDALDPVLQRYTEWTEEELAILRHEHGVNKLGWAEVAQLIPGKTDHRCMEKASHSFYCVL